MTLPKVLEQGKTPAEWVEIFEERGLELSERTLREKARSHKAYYRVGNTMLLMPEHIDKIFEVSLCRLKSTNEETSGGSKVALMASNVTLEKALERATQQSQALQPRKSKGRRGNVRSLDQMRRQKKTS